ncbi:hypothetical protein KHA90_22260 [Flavobacterium psychroterrae]|uniref:Uncharacterized protein n=1 Tax=Flavobacterium psychroterrae TaxID=2133767 RepID=A0ABS5PHF1_9FLAO|nr:hypothetical protein [Flavobacterium psychroterrae]MBS7233744.1 hypothetical protein [Flavobacterium psychroterrae]
MKKLNIKVAVIQLLGMIFLVNGIMQLRFYTVAEKMICAKTHFSDQKSECCDKFFPTKEDIPIFWPNVYIWIFFGLLFGIIIVSFLNWKNKLSPLNSIIVAVAMYFILRLKFFRKGVISRVFNFFRTAFSDDFETQCLIEGVTFTIIGIFTLYLSTNRSSFNLNKKGIEI